MKKVSTLPILFSVVLTFFLIYGLAFASDNTDSAKKDSSTVVAPENNNNQKPETNHNTQQSKHASNSQRGKMDLQFFQNHLHRDMTMAEVTALFGDRYRESLTDQSGEPAWTYDFPKDPTYVTTVPPYAVDEKGILTGKMRYQMSIVWNGDKIKSYIVFYNNNGSIGELKGKFFEGTYANE